MNVEDLAHLELSYAPPYGAARDVVNVAGNLRRCENKITVSKGVIVLRKDCSCNT